MIRPPRGIHLLGHGVRIDIFLVASTPASVVRATSIAGGLGISNERAISVSTAPGKTPCTRIPRLARSARNDCVSDHPAALEAL